MQFFKPHPEKIIPDIDNGYLPMVAGGRYLPDPLPAYWARLEADGDIIPTDPPEQED